MSINLSKLELPREARNAFLIIEISLIVGIGLEFFFTDDNPLFADFTDDVFLANDGNHAKPILYGPLNPSVTLEQGLVMIATPPVLLLFILLIRSRKEL